jgi:hypothetical protein
MTQPDSISGRCLCGAVQVTAKTDTRDVGACHCSMCRRWTGGPLLAVHCGAGVHFAGEAHISTYSSSDWAERGFCKRCGTHLFYRLKLDGQYALPVGLFDDGPGWVLAEQIFIDEKPSFYEFANQTKNLTGEEVFAAYAPPDE